MGKNLARSLAASILLLAAMGAAFGQSNPRYISFTPGATKGALYVPDSGPAPHIAFLVIHRTANEMDNVKTRELSKRGFMVLGLNPRSDNNEAAVHFEVNALDVKQGVEFLRKQPGITKVILVGHSGGGPTTTFYQATAEKGVSYCQGANKLTQCPDSLAGLPKADALVLMDAHPGNSINALRSLNPAVTDESQPNKLDPSLDPFNPANGYNPKGDSTYSAAFQARYFKAQADRMNRLIDKAQQLQADMRAGKHFPADDDVFVLYHLRGRLSDISTGVACCTTRPERFLKNDGTIVVQPIKTVRISQPDNAKRDAEFGSPTGDNTLLTVSSFLSANAIRSTNSMDGIDYCSSNNSTICAVQQISVPMLIMSMGAHYFIADGELEYDRAASKDKEFLVVEGAVHGLSPCRPCAAATGLNYDNATKNIFDYVAKWANTKFPR
jgi:pimeloyl-ACP methyl ester carboxylesterase